MKCFNCNEEMIYRDDIRGLEHADIYLKDLDVTTFSGYLPWNIRYGTNESIMEMQRFMEERNG